MFYVTKVIIVMTMSSSLLLLPLSLIFMTMSLSLLSLSASVALIVIVIVVPVIVFVVIVVVIVVIVIVGFCCYSFVSGRSSGFLVILLDFVVQDRSMCLAIKRSAAWWHRSFFLGAGVSNIVINS